MNMKLETLRKRRSALKQDRKALERARVSADEAQANLEALIAAAAGRFRPPALLVGVNSPGFQAQLYERDPGVDAFALACALYPERVQEFLAEHMTAGEGGVTAENRAARLAQLDAELAELERKEESAIRKLEAQGLDVDRRGDADPAVVLRT
jgi:hypothetical protein